VDWYERARRREFPVPTRLTQAGRLLIARALTQRALANA
jgi:hypothetical protein